MRLGMRSERPPVSRFERRPGPNADPLTRRDQALAFSPDEDWRPPDWFERVAVVLFEPTRAVNIGSVVRAMANTGFSGLRLVNPVAYDPWDVIGVAHYTQHIVDAIQAHATVDAAVADRHLVIGLTGKHQRAKRNALAFSDALDRLADAARDGREVAVLFGREDTGLSIEALDRCHYVTTIPTNPAFPSLNLAQAALLVLYGLFQRAGGEQQTFRPPHRRAGPASSALLEDLFADLERALDAVGFFSRRPRANIVRSLRVALLRADLDAREASLLRAVVIHVRRFLHRRGVIDEVGPIGAEGHDP